ncbi:hypothetical protein ACTFIR_009754 [Dictyostelium discoideum]
MLNQLLLLKNQTDLVNDPFITRIMTGIHKGYGISHLVKWSFNGLINTNSIQTYGNNQCLLVEEECILKKDEISELNKVFNFPSPFGTPEGNSVLSTVKNNDTDLLIVGK